MHDLHEEHLHDVSRPVWTEKSFTNVTALWELIRVFVRKNFQVKFGDEMSEFHKVRSASVKRILIFSLHRYKQSLYDDVVETKLFKLTTDCSKLLIQNEPLPSSLKNHGHLSGPEDYWT